MLNVIVICVDTFRTDLVGDGRKLSFVNTPNLDALKQQCVAFENAYGEGQPTIQMRRNLMTGMRSFPWNENPGDRGLWHLHGSRRTTPQEQERQENRPGSHLGFL